jgi:hypothetical protein
VLSWLQKAEYLVHVRSEFLQLSDSLTDLCSPHLSSSERDADGGVRVCGGGGRAASTTGIALTAGAGAGVGAVGWQREGGGGGLAPASRRRRGVPAAVWLPAGVTTRSRGPGPATGAQAWTAGAEMCAGGSRGGRAIAVGFAV